MDDESLLFADDPSTREVTIASQVPVDRSEGTEVQKCPVEYPKVRFDIDGDIRQAVLDSCFERIHENFYLAKAHGVDLVIDEDTAYFNASNVIRDSDKLSNLMKSDVMKANFDYVKDRLGRTPYYEVYDQNIQSLNGVYMHGIVIGNIIGHAVHDTRDLDVPS